MLAIREYSMHQWALWAADSRHDISCQDSQRWQDFYLLFARVARPAAPLALESRKRPEPVSGFEETSRARPCFRCGVLGHLPAACRATMTTAWKPCARLDPAPRNGNGMVDAAGRAFCFGFTTRSCFSACARTGTHARCAGRVPTEQRVARGRARPEPMTRA